MHWLYDINQAALKEWLHQNQLDTFVFFFKYDSQPAFSDWTAMALGLHLMTGMNWSRSQLDKAIFLTGSCVFGDLTTTTIDWAAPTGVSVPEENCGTAVVELMALTGVEVGGAGAMSTGLLLLNFCCSSTRNFELLTFSLSDTSWLNCERKWSGINCSSKLGGEVDFGASESEKQN